MPAEIVLDMRERALAAALAATGAAVREMRDLPVGDILVQTDGGDALLLERKTRADLMASLNDGRWRDQGARLAETGGRTGYLLEGCLPPTEDVSGDLEDRVITGVIASATARGHLVLLARNVEHSAELLERIAAKMDRQQGGAADPVAMKMVRRRDRSSPRSQTAAMLSQVPGISGGLAYRVVDAYVAAGMTPTVASIVSDGGNIAETALGRGGKRSRALREALGISAEG